MKDKDLFDIVFDKIKKISVPIGLVLVMSIWQAFGIVILRIFNIDYNNLSEVLKIIYLFIFDLLFLGFIIFLYKKDFVRNFKDFFNKNIFTNIGLSFKYWIVGLVIMIISNWIIAVVTGGGLAGNEEAVRDLIDKFPMYMAFQVMIYAPITEELIFRKSIKNAVNNKILYIIISGVVFGGLHVVGNIESALDLLYLIPYCSLGFIFAMLYSKTNNIFSTIVAHSFHNSLALILYLLG